MNRFTSFGIISAILFAILPFATSRHLFSGAVSMKFLLVVVVVLGLASIAALLFFQGRHVLNIKNRPFLWIALGALGVYWLSAFFGVYFERSVFADIQRLSGLFFLTHIAVLAFLLGEFLTPRDWSLVRRTVAVSTAVFSLFTILGTEGFGVSGRILWTNLDISGYTFGNSTFAGTYLLLALVIVLVELVRTQRFTNWWYALAGSAALIFFSPILFNLPALFNLSLPLGSARASSATAILFLIFFGGYWFIKRYAGGVRYALPAWAGLFVVGIVGGVALLFTPGSVVQEKYIQASTAARILVWEGGLEAFKEKPLFGWGPENFERAFQAHFNNDLFLKENIGEVWFDRAHNTVVDTLATAGLAGALAKMALAGGFVWAVYRARRREVIGESEAVVLWALPAAHFLQLQTGFDTVGSFALLGALGGYALWLERTANGEEEKRPRGIEANFYKVGAGVLAVLILLSSVLLLREFERQSALYQIFVTSGQERQLALAETATSRPSSFESLRSASASLIKGVLGEMVQGTATERTVDNALEQMGIYEERYRTYVAEEPEHYRPRIHFAYLLITEAVLNPEESKEKLAEAQGVIKETYHLSPDQLFTPAIEALIELYSGNLSAAEEKAQELLALNPDAEFSKRVFEHIQKQKAQFPRISVLPLGDL